MKKTINKMAMILTMLLISGSAQAAVIYSDTYEAEDTTVYHYGLGENYVIEGDFIVAENLSISGSFSGWGDLSGYTNLTATLSFIWHDDDNLNYANGNIYSDSKNSDTSDRIILGSTYPPYPDLATVSLDGTTVFSNVEVGASDYTTDPSTYVYTLTDLSMLNDDELAFTVSAMKDGPARTDFVLDSIHLSIESPSAVPVPAAVWLLGSGLLGLMGIRRKRQ
jgi:hypothetical protein